MPKKGGEGSPDVASHNVINKHCIPLALMIWAIPPTLLHLDVGDHSVKQSTPVILPRRPERSWVTEKVCEFS